MIFVLVIIVFLGKWLYMDVDLESILYGDWSIGRSGVFVLIE